MENAKLVVRRLLLVCAAAFSHNCATFGIMLYVTLVMPIEMVPVSDAMMGSCVVLYVRGRCLKCAGSALKVTWTLSSVFDGSLYEITDLLRRKRFFRTDSSHSQTGPRLSAEVIQCWTCSHPFTLVRGE